MEEIWKDIKNFEGYQVSNYGNIRTHNKTTYTKKHGLRVWKDRLLKFKTPGKPRGSHKLGPGYRVDLWKDGKPHCFLVARLVLSTFTNTDINTNLTVNHKDGNRLNNNIENLEWLSRADNIRYGFEHNQYSYCKKCILVYEDKEKNIKYTYKFNSLADASIFLGRTKSYLSNVLKYNRKIVGSNGLKYSIKFE